MISWYCRVLQVGMFEAAARAAPGDADVHAALGVLHNLGRTYESAVAAFRCGSKRITLMSNGTELDLSEKFSRLRLNALSRLYALEHSQGAP